MERATLYIHGRVQGVFFRHSARIEAERLGITGVAENLEDGSLSIIAEGERSALDQFIAWCRKGPMLARVDDVGLGWSEASGEFKSFIIR